MAKPLLPEALWKRINPCCLSPKLGGFVTPAASPSRIARH